MQPWTLRSVVLAAGAVVLFLASVWLLRNSLGGPAGGIGLVASPVVALVGAILGGVALARKEPRGLALAATVVNAVLALFGVAFLVLLIEAIRNFT